MNNDQLVQAVEIISTPIKFNDEAKHRFTVFLNKLVVVITELDQIDDRNLRAATLLGEISTILHQHYLELVEFKKSDNLIDSQSEMSAVMNEVLNIALYYDSKESFLESVESPTVLSQQIDYNSELKRNLEKIVGVEEISPADSAIILFALVQCSLEALTVKKANQ